MSTPSSPAIPSDALAALAQRIGWSFTDVSLLARAMAHRSWCAEQGAESNERLEFLGDAVLGLVITNHIFRTYPQLPEGDLAKLRASLVNAAVLAEVASGLDIGAALLLGKGEAATGGRAKSSILADALEAVIGAVYLDGGWEPAEALVMRLLAARIDLYSSGPGGNDFKTRLQELVARRFETLPVYRVTDAGPDHAKTFQATVAVSGAVRGRGEGRSKKQAEQGAARLAWESISAELAGSAAVAPAADIEAADIEAAADRGTGSAGTGAADTGTVDTGAVDTGTVDTGTVDTGAVDTGAGGTGARVDTTAALRSA